MGERAFTVTFANLSRSPSKAKVDMALRKQSVFDKVRDVVVCYITGHSEEKNQAHRLVLSTSVPGKPSSMLPTSAVLE